ncbi:uncharacterized protein LOC141911054 [Tubulanus polymorphus]|uniref:uncharacterized protein LOC141911054 n=1 Tax=Tubulanus polymorphus TaxID=672921 RepID=UPI003DA6AEF6
MKSMMNKRSVVGKTLRISEPGIMDVNRIDAVPLAAGHNNRSIKRPVHEKELFKEILRKNRGILMRNMTPSEDMMRLFREHKIFTDSMAQDITESRTRTDAVKMILDLLPLRGISTFQIFCDILELTGHSLLVELLKDDGGIATVQIDTSDLVTRHPNIDRNLRPADKYDLGEYIQDKIKDYLIKQRIRNCGDKRDYSSPDLKQRLVEVTWAHQKEIQIKNATIKDIETKAVALKTSLEEKIADLKSIIAEQNQTQDKLKDDLQIQYNFNLANDKSLQRYQQKIEAQDRLLSTLCNRWKDNGYFWEHGTDDVTDNDESATSAAVGDVTHKFERFLKKVRELEDYKKKYTQLLGDQNRLLSHVMSCCDIEAAADEECLLNALNDHIHKKDLTISNLQADAGEYKNRIAYLENRHKEVFKEFEAMQTKAMELEYKLNCSSEFDESDDDERAVESSCDHKRGRSRSHSQKSSKKVVTYDYDAEIARLKEVVEQKDSTINLLEFEIKRLQQEAEFDMNGSDDANRLNGLITTRERTRFVPKSRATTKKSKSGSGDSSGAPKKLPPLKIVTKPRDKRNNDNKDVASSKSSPSVVSEFFLNGWDYHSDDDHLYDDHNDTIAKTTIHDESGPEHAPDEDNTHQTVGKIKRQTSVKGLGFGYKFNRGECIDLSAIQQKLIEPEF